MILNEITKLIDNNEKVQLIKKRVEHFEELHNDFLGEDVWEVVSELSSWEKIDFMIIT